MAACLASVAVAVATIDVDEPIVLASYVPRRWHLVAPLAIGGTIALISAAVHRVHALELAARRPGRRVLRTVGLALATTATLLASGIAALSIGLLDAVSGYHVLSPTSAQGCRVLVAEDTFLLLGSGRVFLVPPGSRSPRQVATFSADDGYAPITSGTYRLTWNGSTADLDIWGSEDMPIGYDPVPLQCSG
ncbi:hypothetical protein [Kineococcus gypseus]|uniref:hypothetical protein n=1 Tax=Kineococcus gypseus TaxID=1637102 RepID=UPI003D7D9E54